MISNDTKEKLINSFNSLEAAAHNLKATIGNEGKRAFADGDTQDISELLVLMTKMNEIIGKINKIAPSFRTYRLDLATQSKPDELGIGENKHIKNLNRQGTKKPETVEGSLYGFSVDGEQDIPMFITPNNIGISPMVTLSVHFKNGQPVYADILPGNRIVLGPKADTAKIRDRINRAVQNGIVKLTTTKDPNNDENTIMEVIQNMRFKSLGVMCSMILGEQVQNSREALRLLQFQSKDEE